MTMRAAVFVALLASSALAEQERAAASVTPIQKVIQMLNDMLSKAKAEKEDEEVRFAAYKQFCASTSTEKEQSIAKGKEEIEKLQADIAEADSEALALGKDIGSLDTDMATWDTELKEATAVREKAHADFVKTNEEYTESIASVDQAVETIKGGGGASFAQTSLLEVGEQVVSQSVRRQIMSFIQKASPETKLMQDAMEVEDMSGAPEAAAFEGKSGGVLEMVQGLGEKFEDERDKLQKEEMNEKHAHDMITQDLTSQMENAKKSSEKKASTKASREQDKANAEGDLSDTTATLAEDTKFLTDLTAECEQKSIDFGQRQETRQGEIEAIMKAIEIMSSDKVSGAGDKHLPGFVQTALAQLRTGSRSKSQYVVADFLAQRARMTNSRVLSLIAVKAEADPFKKVVKMIKDMIQKLMEEAADEAEHKGFCDTEMGTNKITRDSKSDEVASLTAEIDETTAAVAKLSEEIAALGAAVSATDAALSKATAERQAEKAKNTATIEDAKVASEAVGQALTVLKEFYDKAASATALTQQGGGAIQYDQRALAIMDAPAGASMLQTTVPGAPDTFDDKPYTGMANGGVMGMLEVIQSDFARLLSETTAAESEAAKEFTEFSNDSAMDKAVKGQDMKNKEGQKTKKESAIAAAKKDLAGSQEELDAAMAYFEKLKPSCVDAGESYEDRVARRKEEIESLQEALKILSE